MYSALRVEVKELQGYESRQLNPLVWQLPVTMCFSAKPLTDAEKNLCVPVDFGIAMFLD